MIRHRFAFMNRFVCAAAALAAGLLATSALPVTAHAELIPCSSDPVLVLSNGVTLDLQADINDSASDVQQVSYTVHGPVGTEVVSLVSTPGVLGPNEVVGYDPDTELNTYTISTVVTTVTPRIAVVATTHAISATGTSSTATASGWNNQQLRVALSW